MSFLMRYGCPNKTCKYPNNKTFIVKDGFFFRANDSRKIQRYKCKVCGSKFSTATFSLAKNQKKRRVNYPLFKLICSGMSMRRAAYCLGVHKLTVRRKVLYLAKKARLSQEEFLRRLGEKQIESIQIDDLITIEHTKLKPLSVTVMVDKDKRVILGTKVSQIPSFGHLARYSRKKYGPRPSELKEGVESLFSKLKHSISGSAHFESDEHNLYPVMIRKFFPNSTHSQFESQRATVAGQGEMKNKAYDPIFNINHTLAMMRADINRLIRRTWSTTKDPERLQDHLDVYTWFFNQKRLGENLR